MDRGDSPGRRKRTVPHGHHFAISERKRPRTERDEMPVFAVDVLKHFATDDPREVEPLSRSLTLLANGCAGRSGRVLRVWLVQDVGVARTLERVMVKYCHNATVCERSARLLHWLTAHHKDNCVYITQQVPHFVSTLVLLIESHPQSQQIRDFVTSSLVSFASLDNGVREEVLQRIEAVCHSDALSPLRDIMPLLEAPPSPWRNEPMEIDDAGRMLSNASDAMFV